MSTAREITEARAKISGSIESLATDADIIALVKEIEGRTMTTKGHYGEYMRVLTQWGNDNKTMLFIVSEALKKAGANAYGVDWVVKIITGGN
jgi:RNA binding exosome subunit